MRGRMSDAPSYAAPVVVGDVMVGGTVSRLGSSRHPDYQQGDLVLSNSGWQDYAFSDGTDVTKLDPIMSAHKFDAVFYPGGHGPLWDLAEDASSIALIEAMLATGKPVALVSHAPAALRHAKTPSGIPLVQDRAVTGFIDTEEEAVGLTQVVPFPVEDMLKKNGGRYSNVATGNPMSSLTDC